MVRRMAKQPGAPKELVENPVKSPSSPPGVDAIVAIKTRINDLTTRRATRLQEIERSIARELAQYDVAIKELNALLIQLGSQPIIIDLNVRLKQRSAVQPTTREAAVAAASPAAILRKRIRG